MIDRIQTNLTNNFIEIYLMCNYSKFLRKEILKINKFGIFGVCATFVMILTGCDGASGVDRSRFSGVLLATRNASECEFENIQSEIHGFYVDFAVDEKWIKIIESRLSKADIIRSDSVPFVESDKVRNLAKNNRAITIAYEARRHGFSANVVAAIVVYFNQEKYTKVPISKKTLGDIKRELLSSGVSQFCYDEEAFRSNLRMFLTVLREMADNNPDQVISEWLHRYLIEEAEKNKAEATLIVDAINEILKDIKQ